MIASPSHHCDTSEVLENKEKEEENLSSNSLRDVEYQNPNILSEEEARLLTDLLSANQRDAHKKKLALVTIANKAAFFQNHVCCRRTFFEFLLNFLSWTNVNFSSGYFKGFCPVEFCLMFIRLFLTMAHII